MDLTARLRAWALARPRVLVVDPPGSDSLRWAVEEELDRRGWPRAAVPAETDVLLVLGEPGPGLAAAVDVLWTQVPAPRHRARLTAGFEVAAALDAGRAALLAGGDADRPDPEALLGGGEEHGDEESGADDGSDQGDAPDAGDDARDDPGDDSGQDEASPHEDAGEGGMDHGGMDHGGMDHGGMDHGGMDDGGMDDGGMDDGGMDDGGMDDGGMDDGGMDDGGMDDGGMDHGGMDHGGMDHGGMDHGGMEIAGLPMAQTGPDRDGLELDVLSVNLGPVLPAWPTGLVLRAEVQGDVVTGAELSWTDDPAPAADPEPQRLALDRLARLLEVAGWSAAARDARRARDGLGSADPDRVVAAGALAAALTRRVRRSRTLAWSLRGAGRPADEPGDGVLDLVRDWCAAATGDAPPPAGAPLDELAGRLEGAELGSARLLVAARAPAPVPVGADRG
ncbi:hypothetical protein ACI8AC_01680 [Geodermatophilus sp. SYSU D00758]